MQDNRLSDTRARILDAAERLFMAHGYDGTSMRQITGEYSPANPIEVMTVVSALYLLVAFSVNRVMALIERKTRVPGYISGGH